jgi:hypothetical protein
MAKERIPFCNARLRRNDDHVRLAIRIQIYHRVSPRGSEIDLVQSMEFTVHQHVHVGGDSSGVAGSGNYGLGL